MVQTIFTHNPRLLFVQTVPPPMDITAQLPIQSISVEFIYPSFLYESISDRAKKAFTDLSQFNIANVFSEKYCFVLDLPATKISNEAVDPLIMFSELMHFQYSSKKACLYRHPFEFDMNFKWKNLSSPDSDPFLFDPPSTLNIYLSSLAMNIPLTIQQIMKLTELFIENNLWNNIDIVHQNQSIKLYMCEIYNRDLWTCPLVSFIFSQEDYGYIVFSMLRSDSFVQRVRSKQIGKFKKGVCLNWLPDGYSAGFFFFKRDNMILLEFIETIGWDFDPELADKTPEQYALNRSMTVANLASFITSNISNQ
ncbi:hypothetical protein TVAG_026800 [Trichomonas vaginalis G3]|uniref:Uncharacterized protein n=1 Tax=Trichomonas vaginalis (strain ATCC PRA-98 / G3) TaxID=412133 RepID=A2DZ83_TRIV3|nr:hypothetical protein TVAGG3_0505370 [Trichomonas vaginalis G3]EAY14359.1 hypothetical protein TVAG_026800 [Trichomonas vaginalis G3]KAI5517384.1 hypothetical protein TVAGG3_0505370 [Trichomonas vaginalis G3]|eukprot:XP_001326582.1 hypothetical protein [Trichomonas vaginalis G3]